jgi:hypothetical protein
MREAVRMQGRLIRFFQSDLIIKMSLVPILASIGIRCQEYGFGAWSSRCMVRFCLRDSGSRFERTIFCFVLSCDLCLNFVNSSMKSSKTSMDSLIAAGLIGASLGAFLSNDKEEGAVIGAILGAAISATTKASIEARKTQLPQMVEEHGALYEIDVNGEKRLVKNLNKTTRLLPDQFQLI